MESVGLSWSGQFLEIHLKEFVLAMQIWSMQQQLKQGSGARVRMGLSVMDLQMVLDA